MHSVEEQRRCGEENLVNAEILKLRNRWELASVLNFLEVFSPILGKDLKASAEEIEIGLVKPDVSLAKLHIQLLKGIPPVNRTLNDPDKWVTVLCKKLVTWWQWVAVGKIPLMPSKGEEISKYKELDSSDRLLLLKALCEVRADQHDAVSYINDALKEGTHITSIRKEALGRDGTGTSYWYDANAKCQSHRLYRGRITSVSNPKVNGIECLSLPPINFKWESVASNLEEFSEIAEKFHGVENITYYLKRKVSPGSDQDRNKGLEVKSDGEDVSSDSGSEGGMLQISDTDGDDSGYEIENPGEIEYHVDSSEEDNNADDSEQGNPETHSSNAVSYHPKGSRCSMRLAGVSSHCILESRGLTSKQRLRQRPTPNSAIDSVVVSDSDDEAAQEGKAGLPEST
ncbi:PREDICTED: DDT domain-containing protein DDR4 [Lupinus angustifolius]|uniref:DDT domain-containing protein DDR4 n=1 Tax=Lupinus angustifolius TaxID=3871 RepID=UPI00092E7D11|nr:PREDICTED: DDT domain-containing protein DDR4 [Lupinus angustifolius]